MIRIRTGKLTTLAASLSLALAGCSAKTENVDDAIVTIEPGVNVTAVTPSTTATTTPATPTTTKAPGTTAAAPKEGPATTSTKVEGWGTLKGRVLFGGEPPEPKTLVKKGAPDAKDSAICAVNAIPSQRLVVDKASKGVRYAVVYVPKPTAVHPEAMTAAQNAEVVFDQAQCIFEPHVLGVLKGSKVQIKSSDKVSHNINSKLSNTKFNDSIAPGQQMVKTPAAAERLPGEVRCDIHPWMSAWWLVSESPYFAVTDAQGNFEIKNVPAGSQKIVVWQEATGPITVGAGDPVDVKPGGETTKDYTIDPGKVKPEG